MRVLVACEFSGVVRQAFRRLGHDAWSCDLLPSEDDSPYHVIGDVRRILDAGWDLLIAFPPCTFLCNSGSRWLYGKDGEIHAPRWLEMQKAVEFFLTMLNAPVPKIAVENPLMHKYARARIGRRHDQVIQPCMFGHAAQKATCFWLKNLPHLEQTIFMDGRIPESQNAADSKDRWKKRSRTLPGVADAMAAQWGMERDNVDDGERVARGYRTRRRASGKGKGRRTGVPAASAG